MSERPPQPPTQENGVNSYGTDDPVQQARIEAARTAAAKERKANREKLERYVELGLNPEDATALIEHEDMLRQQREATGEAGEQDKQTAPRIYVRSLVDYNEGHLIGDWIDADQNVEDIQADIQTILGRSLHAHWTGEPAEEWAIHDCEGFGRFQVHEHEALETIAVLGQGIAEHGLAFAAWAEITDAVDVEALDRFQEAYLGAFESRQAYAEHVIAEMEAERHLATLPEWLRNITRIDYEAMIHEMETSGSVRFADHPGGVWVFDGRV